MRPTLGGKTVDTAGSRKATTDPFDSTLPHWSTGGLYSAYRDTPGVSRRTLQLLGAALCRDLVQTANFPMRTEELPAIGRGLEFLENANPSATVGDLIALHHALRAEVTREVIDFFGALGNDGIVFNHASALVRGSLGLESVRRTLQWLDNFSFLRTFVCRVEDILGPLNPPAIESSWLTETVVGAARGIYTDRAFDRLSALADELEDVECADRQILLHCRSDEPRARGCWVVDLILGYR